MKSVLIVTEQFTMGGLETHIRGEILRLSAAGVDVHLATGKAFDNALLPDSFAAFVHDLPLDPTATPEELLTAINRLRQIIREHSIEIVHIHPFASIIPAAVAAELESIPYAITLHGPASLASYGEIYDLLVKDFILPNSGLIVAVSPEVKKLLSVYVANESVALIPNAVSFVESTEIAPKLFDLDSRWLVVSRLDEFKIQGIMDFCDKAKAAGIPGVLIVGDGPAKDDLIQKINDQGLASYANLIGASTQVHSLMQKTSGVAGMGRVVLEGVASRKPVVLVGYDGVKGVVDKTLLALAAEENFSGRGLPTIDSGELCEQLQSKTTDVYISAVHEFSKTTFNDRDVWSLFLERLNSVSQSKPSALAGLYHALSGIPIKGSTPYLYSLELLDRLESVTCSKNYYDQRLTAALMFCRQRLERGSLNRAVADRDGQIVSLNQAVADRDGQIVSFNQAVADRDGQIVSLGQAIVDRDGQIVRLSQAVAGCDEQIASLGQAIIDRDGQIGSLRQAVADRDEQIASLGQAIIDRDGQIGSLSQAVADRDEQIASLGRAIIDRDGQIVSLNQAVADRDEQIASLNQAVADRDERLHAAYLYKEDKEIYVAMLKYEIERLNSTVVGKIARIGFRLKRVPYYTERSLAIVRSKGFRGLLSAVSSSVKRRGTGIENNYIAAPVTETQLSGDLESKSRVLQSIEPSLLGGALVIITGVPFDDIGGGQRAAQLARCALRTGRKVVYLYIYRKFDFELNRHIESDVNIHGLVHECIDSISPHEVLRLVSSDATLLIELPHKEALPYLKLFNSRGMRSVFELIDDWESSLGGDWFDLEVYRSFVNESKFVVGTAKILVKKLESLGRADVLYLPNAADEYIFDKYKNYSRPADLPSGYRRIALYFGSLYGEWFSWDCIQEAAARNADIAFILIGDRPNSKLLPALPSNVHMLGGKLIQELSAYLAHSDFTLLPFSPGKISDAVSPIKVFEYLFSGRPVVSTNLPEIFDYPGVSIAHSPEEFARLCSEVEITDVLRKRNDTFIFQNSWFSRLEHIIGQSGRSEFKKNVSAIILIHNNKSIIGRCLESLLLHCGSYLKEVIVVDNASVDGGAEYIEAHFPSVKIVQNAVNGCSSGRNLGARIASGECLAFFDSDQWFTSAFCFEEALSILQRDANVGVIGWAAGWFDAGREDLGGMIADYCPNRAMNEFAIKRGYRSDIGYLGTGGFFVPRAVFEATEGFDVAYDPTCFEDTDMSFQIKRLGLDVCYRDLTGIRHQPHQTTQASGGSDAYVKLFNRNADYFKKKWSGYPQFFLDYSH